MKKWIASALCAVMALSLSTAAFAAKPAGISPPAAKAPADAAQAAGFGLTAPGAANGSDSRVHRAVKEDLLEVIYRKGGEETARIRKASGGGDISGDYTVYPQVSEVSVNGNQVTMSGSGDLVSLAVWTGGGYTYAVSAAGGLSRGDMTALVAAIQ